MIAKQTLLVSASEDYYPVAVAELRRQFGDDLTVERVGLDVAAISRDGLTAAKVARACRSAPLFFPRHVTVEVLRTVARSLEALGDAALTAVEGLPRGEVAVQSWSSGEPRFGYGPAEASRVVTDVLRRNGFTVVRAGAGSVLSCCVTSREVCFGINRTADSLSDWPGGRVRLGRGPEQVSRSEFKLEELVKVHPLRLPATGRAMDLGAAPGGWTRIVRTLGLDVWAVDPGALDPRVLADPGVHHAATTAGEFLRSTRHTYDMVVNDMRMDPLRSSQIMVDAAAKLRPGAVAILTLKVGDRQVLATIDECLRLLAKIYTVTFGRNLHHNRHEVTVAMTRR